MKPFQAQMHPHLFWKAAVIMKMSFLVVSIGIMQAIMIILLVSLVLFGLSGVLFVLSVAFNVITLAVLYWKRKKKCNQSICMPLYQ